MQISTLHWRRMKPLMKQLWTLCTHLMMNPIHRYVSHSWACLWVVTSLHFLWLCWCHLASWNYKFYSKLSGILGLVVWLRLIGALPSLTQENLKIFHSSELKIYGLILFAGCDRVWLAVWRVWCMISVLPTYFEHGYSPSILAIHVQEYFSVVFSAI